MGVKNKFIVYSISELKKLDEAYHEDNYHLELVDQYLSDLRSLSANEKIDQNKRLLEFLINSEQEPDFDELDIDQDF